MLETIDRRGRHHVIETSEAMATAIPQQREDRPAVSPEDRDSIDTFALGVLPVMTAGLKRLRLVKNPRLESRVELYRGAGIGSGQIAIDDLPGYLEPGQDLLDHDIPLLRRVGAMPSFDCYSLRRAVRASGLVIEDDAVLSLSDQKKAELARHMRNLTRPLVRYVFGGGRLDIFDPSALRDALAQAETRDVRQKLSRLSDILETSLDELPDLLEDYADAYMSLGYFRAYLNLILPRVENLLRWIDEAAVAEQFRQGDSTAGRIGLVRRALDFLVKAVSERFFEFERRTIFDWEGLTIEEFAGARRQILEHQASLAEVLCGLTVKVSDWHSRYGSQNVAMQQRAEFVVSDLQAGLDRLVRVEKAAPRF